MRPAIAPLLASLLAACVGGAPRLPSPPGPGVERAGGATAESEGGVLVVRTADPVAFRPAGEVGPEPLYYYRRQARIGAGGWVSTGSGGEASLTFPEGSAARLGPAGTVEVVDPKGGEGPLFRAHRLRRLDLSLQGPARVELPGGVVVSGDGARLVARLERERLLRIENRSGAPVAVRYRDAEVVLASARFVDVPYAEESNARGADRGLQEAPR